jgi:hypothetical protein
MVKNSFAQPQAEGGNFQQLVIGKKFQTLFQAALGEHGIRQSGFAVVNMGYYGDVAQI